MEPIHVELPDERSIVAVLEEFRDERPSEFVFI
jgi:hypothetical protein